MCADTQGLLDPCPTRATILTGVSRFNGDDRDSMEHPIVLDPGQEDTPTSIMDGLGQVMVLEHVRYLKVFIGNQIVR